VPFDEGFEVNGEGGGDEVWAGVFVEWGFGLAEFVDGVVAIEFDSHIVAAVEGESCFEGGDADLLVVDPDAGTGGGRGDADSSFDAAGEGEEGEEEEEEGERKIPSVREDADTSPVGAGEESCDWVRHRVPPGGWCFLVLVRRTRRL